jgi:ribosome maturation factor RimP
VTVFFGGRAASVWPGTFFLVLTDSFHSCIVAGLESGPLARFFFILMNETLTGRVAELVTELVEPILAEMGLELVEVQFRREQMGWVLRLIIYRATGVTVEDCVTVSREVSNLLDVEDLIEQPYHLEVSSPGLDRPLKTARDFARYQGQKIKVATKAPMDDQQEIVGLIHQVKEESVVVAAGQERIEIPYARIAKARLVIEF